MAGLKSQSAPANRATTGTAAAAINNNNNNNNTVQRYNAVLLHDTLPAPDCTD